VWVLGHLVANDTFQGFIVARRCIHSSIVGVKVIAATSHVSLRNRTHHKLLVTSALHGVIAKVVVSACPVQLLSLPFLVDAAVQACVGCCLFH
jgi:hypothetical protein